MVGRPGINFKNLNFCWHRHHAHTCSTMGRGKKQTPAQVLEKIQQAKEDKARGLGAAFKRPRTCYLPTTSTPPVVPSTPSFPLPPSSLRSVLPSVLPSLHIIQPLPPPSCRPSSPCFPSCPRTVLPIPRAVPYFPSCPHMPSLPASIPSSHRPTHPSPFSRSNLCLHTISHCPLTYFLLSVQPPSLPSRHSRYEGPTGKGSGLSVAVETEVAHVRSCSISGPSPSRRQDEESQECDSGPTKRQGG